MQKYMADRNSFTLLIVLFIIPLFCVPAHTMNFQGSPPGRTRDGKQATSGSSLAPSLSKKIDEIATAYAKLGRFSGAVLVAKEGRLLFSKGYGLASLEFGVPNTPQTKFNIGSLSKQFTAAAILKLESEGKLSVNDTISSHLPDYPKPQGEQITIHHLLTHTSGIPSVGRSDGLPDVKETGEPIRLKDLIAISAGKELQFKPGEKYRYNNSAYTVLLAIIEKASGMKYEDYLKKNLFDPAGMHDTGRINDWEIVPQSASGYMGYQPDVVRPPYVHPSWRPGSAGIYSTVEDLFKWDQALYGDKILPRDEKEKLFKPHVKRTRPDTYYGYGWFIEKLYGHNIIFHGGTAEGYICECYRFPEDKLLVVVLANYLPEFGVDVPADIVERISALMLGREYDTPPVAVKVEPSRLSRFAGGYQFEPGYTLRVSLEGDRLTAKAEGSKSWSLATYSNQVKLDEKSESVIRAMRVIDAFVKGDRRFIYDLLTSKRKQEVTVENFSGLPGRMTESWGQLIHASPYELNKTSGQEAVLTRLTFARKEIQMSIVFSEKGELLIWGLGSTMPSEALLIPESATRFFVDGFRYGEKDFRLEFTLDRGKVTGLILKDSTGAITAKRLP